MFMQIFTVFDKAAEAYTTPFFLPTTGLAIRSFIETANDEKTSVSKYPSDFTLVHLGSYDDQVSVFTLFDEPEKLGTALTFKERESNE